MRTNILKLAVLLSLIAVFILGSAIEAEANYPSKDFPRWEKLGSRKVNHALDRDEIFVTAYEGSFTALRLKIEKSDINLHKVTVHYRRGRPEVINVRQSMRSGTLSPTLDLKGNRRIISKVTFWYDTKGYEQRRGKIELWGRH